MPLKSDKTRRALAGVALATMAIGLMWASWRGLYRDLQTSSSTPTSTSKSAEVVASPQAMPSSSPASAARNRTLKFLSQESQRVGAPVERPDEADARLDAFANSATDAEADVLAERSLDTNVNEDERFLATEVLARLSLNSNPARLEKIVLAPFTMVKDAESTRGSIEWLVRARATEGFEKFTTSETPTELRKEAAQRLRALLPKITAPLLRDRAQSALARFDNPNLPSTQKADTEALERSLQR